MGGRRRGGHLEYLPYSFAAAQTRGTDCSSTDHVDESHARFRALGPSDLGRLRLFWSLSFSNDHEHVVGKRSRALVEQVGVAARCDEGDRSGPKQRTDPCTSILFPSSIAQIQEEPWIRTRLDRRTERPSSCRTRHSRPYPLPGNRAQRILFGAEPA
jgi:hypothetical protein